MVQSDSGAIGGSVSHEFMVITTTDAGENDVFYCDDCDYSANSNHAISNLPGAVVDGKDYFNKNEILNVKWFSYEELISMNEDLRLYYWIIDAIQAYKDNKIMNLNIIKMDNDVINKNITELH